MGKIIAITNQKGGVGKTTTTVNLAASLAVTRHSVLLIDLDPQGNATMGCGIEKNEVEYSSCSLLLDDVEFKDVVVTSEGLGFDVISSNADLTAAEVELMSVDERERRLAKALAPVRADYEYILIDCPPSLNLLTLNALVAADSVLVPMQCEYYSLEGLSALLETFSQVRKSVNPKLDLEGLLRTMFDSRSRLTKEVSNQLINHFEDKVFRTVIPRNIRLAEAPSHGLPVIKYDKSSKGALAYLALASEMVRRDEKEARKNPKEMNKK